MPIKTEAAPIKTEAVSIENEAVPIENEFVLGVLSYSDWRDGEAPPRDCPGFFGTP